MKLSVITITCRTDPRLPEMARTLIQSLSAAPADTRLEWIIVDDRLLGEGARETSKSVRELVFAAVHGVASEGVMDRFSVNHTPPLPSPHRGPQVASPAPAHNSARNAGLFACADNVDYIVFLNDCSIVTVGWAAVAVDCALAGKGWRCKEGSIQDIKLPDGHYRHKDHHDRLRPVPATTVGGACWGAPAASFGKIRGFDLAYDGEAKGHELDAVVRLARTGLAFVTTERAYTVRLRRTLTSDEVSTRQEVFVGNRNKILLNELTRDRSRVLPVIEAKPAVRSAPKPKKEKSEKPRAPDSGPTRLPGVAPAPTTAAAAPLAADAGRPAGDAPPPVPGDPPAGDDPRGVEFPPPRAVS